MTVKISPSLLSADFANLTKELKKLEKAKADMLHLDVMDGNYVDNISFGPALIKKIRSVSKIFFDAHLMINDVDKYIPVFAKSGCDSITFHMDTTKDIEKTIKLIRKHKCRVGIALKPKTSVTKVKKYLPLIDSILVMTVNPGFSGQRHISQQDKIKKLKELSNKNNFEISVDGGVNNKNSKRLIKAGADVLVSGNFIFKSKNYKKAIQELRREK